MAAVIAIFAVLVSGMSLLMVKSGRIHGNDLRAALDPNFDFNLAKWQEEGEHGKDRVVL
jgi:hypothetical protein